MGNTKKTSLEKVDWNVQRRGSDREAFQAVAPDSQTAFSLKKHLNYSGIKTSDTFGSHNNLVEISDKASMEKLLLRAQKKSDIVFDKLSKSKFARDLLPEPMQQDQRHDISKEIAETLKNIEKQRNLDDAKKHAEKIDPNKAHDGTDLARNDDEISKEDLDIIADIFNDDMNSIIINNRKGKTPPTENPDIGEATARENNRRNNIDNGQFRLF